MRFNRLITTILLTICATSVHAGLVVSDIQMDIVHTNYNYTHAAHHGAGMSDAQSVIDGATSRCSVSLTEIDMVRPCGLKRNYGQKIDISLSSDKDVYIEVGTDWGRGGLFALNGDYTNVLGDTWWARRWNHGDVIDITIDKGFSGVLSLIGFEGCCGGQTSVRYSYDNKNWQTLAVSVPEPGTLTLMAIGMVGLVALRRRSATGARSA